MNQCSVCGGEIVDTLTNEFRRDQAIVVDPKSAIGRRMLAGLCWVCQRLGLTAARHAVD